MGAETLRFTTGECDVSGSFFALHLGTLVPSAPTSPRPYFGLLVKAPRGGVFKGAVVAFSSNGTRHALTRANKTPFGLGGSIWSSDPRRAYALADRLEAGMVWINRHGGAWDHIPFLGSKQSGIGSELGGVHALHEYTQLKIVNIKHS